MEGLALSQNLSSLKTLGSQRQGFVTSWVGLEELKAPLATSVGGG